MHFSRLLLPEENPGKKAGLPCVAKCTINRILNYIKQRKENSVLTNILQNTMITTDETGFISRKSSKLSEKRC